MLDEATVVLLLGKDGVDKRLLEYQLYVRLTDNDALYTEVDPANSGWKARVTAMVKLGGVCCLLLDPKGAAKKAADIRKVVGDVSRKLNIAASVWEISCD